MSITTLSHNPPDKDSGGRPTILQIVPSLDTGGAERTTVEIAAALHAAGFLPLVVSEGGRLLGELGEAGAEWIKMPVNAKSPVALVRNAWRLRDLIRTRNIALVHARSRAPAWSALWAARQTGVPFVTTYHGLYTANFPLKRLYNSVMARADAVIANSQWTAAHIRSEYKFAPKRLVVIPRGVDFARFNPSEVAHERVAALRDSWGAGEQDLVLLLPGRLTRLKGQGVFIEALARLRNSRSGMPPLRAVLAGDSQGRDAYTTELRRLVVTHRLNDIVVIAGHVSDMPAACLAADIVISASTQAESFGRTVAEASAMGRPVIATDHGGARETILPELSGVLVAPGNADALATALLKLIAMGPDGRASMGAQGKAYIAANFTVERMQRETIELYLKLLHLPALPSQ